MAQQVKLKLELENGTKIARFKSFTLTQDLFNHHFFELTVPFRELEKQDEVFFHDAHQNVCGQGLSVSFDDIAGKKSFDFRFRGIVTSILLSNLADFSNVFVIRGYSPTMLLEDSGARRTFLKKTVQQVFDKILSDYPGNVLKKKLNPRSKSIIPYVVQYDETNFAFLNRLAAEHGEWFYYNGEELRLGSSTDGKDIDFVIDGNQSFDMSISLVPAKFSMQAYDYTKDQSYKGKSSSQAVEGLARFSQFALDKSEGLFSRESALLAGKPAFNQQDLDEQIKFRRSAVASTLLVFHGRGDNPNLTVGTVINVSTTRPDNGGRGKPESIGKYRITEISHSIDGNGNYSNFFRSVPETAKFPPVNETVIHPVARPELATVTDNNDPEKMSRVKVNFSWPGEDKESDWMRVGQFYGGGDDRKGIQFIPEKDAQVMIGYESQKPESPFVMTTLYPKKDGMRSRKGNNEEKAFYTKAGNLIEFSDKQNANQIRITNTNKDDTELLIEFKENGAISLKTKGKISLEADQDISLKAKQKISLQAQELEFRADNKASLKGASVSIEADASAEFKGGAGAKISSPNTELSGDAMTTIKGGLVKIN